MIRKRSRSASAGISILTLLSAAAVATTTTAAHAHGPASRDCRDQSVTLSVEESRLTFTLPDNDNPAVLQSRPFAQQMIDGAGFQGFTPAFVRQLCGAGSLTAAEALVSRRAAQLWRMAVDRAQRRDVRGDLPYSDDRPLYWTRVQATAAIRQWTPRFALTSGQRLGLIEAFDRGSRGMFDITLPRGERVKRVIVSGFDPYTLDGGPAGTAPGAAGNNIRHGNPSGATALSLDGTTYRTTDGEIAYVEAYTLPVSFPEFRRGYLEDTVGPYMVPGPRQVDASITVSQAGGSQFNLEQWNARYHGVSLGNDRFRPCPQVNGVPQLAINNPECNTMVVDRWGGPSTFDLRNPPQWTSATLPIAEMIAADTGRNVPRPPGDTWPDQSVAFGVVWNTSYTQFPDCASPTRETRNSPPPVQYPPVTPPIAPDPQGCSYSGGGGNYLSNESAYRNTLLRDRMGLDIPAGHIHTPDMQHFETDYQPSDATFDAWRLAIAQQTRNLIHAVAETVD
ncbi:hypothetical protein SAMN05444365_104410 [Micromonospora pattaloongensis]|uniref:Pyrrolidone-carboxylate peptidase (N-terminal pyroglutamyl peptidase) n=1 Tax=Micromonospora pattaloongensis TaxID=405436 RepID=A0A1H3PA77_9ACTN|nr:hypothetical protein [Micromonospora pattaloongensis]SDY97997.1 hypothetical protein SAMN05444365_104410 [Micromonospora pattaloongensis]